MVEDREIQWPKYTMEHEEIADRWYNRALDYVRGFERKIKNLMPHPLENLIDGVANKEAHDLNTVELENLEDHKTK